MNCKASCNLHSKDDFCQTREERESRLRQKANDVLKKFPGEAGLSGTEHSDTLMGRTERRTSKALPQNS